MQRKSFSGMNCSIARSLEEVGEWWSLLIVREMTQGMNRFDQFQKELGIARNILTARLERLTELGIVERYPLPDRASTEGYRLTPKGEDLYPVLLAMLRWGNRYKVDEPPLQLVHKSCGHNIDPLMVCNGCKEELHRRELRAYFTETAW